MERGVFIGGVLIAASLLIAVLLNSKSRHENDPAPAAEQNATEIVEPNATTGAVDGARVPVRVSSHVATAPQPSTEQNRDNGSDAARF